MITALAFGLAFGVAAPGTAAAQGRGAKARVENAGGD
jgi:hypothetical protein